MTRSHSLGTLPTDAAGELDVLRHDGDSLGVDSAQVGVFKKTNQVRLRSLLESHDRGRLEPQVGLEVLGDLADKTLERQLPDEELSALLVAPDLTESDGARSVTMGLLHTSGGWCTFASSLGGKLLPWGLSASAFASSLLCTCHLSLSNEHAGNGNGPRPRNIPAVGLFNAAHCE